ncbi:MAG: hypothetical protein RL701_5029, partial [Pseudomonadota bacterium]
MTVLTDEDLTTLDGIRGAFLARFQTAGIGYHTLGEQVLREYFSAEHQHPRPASAMTFRNFLQDRTTLRDPTGLLLYFEALGANADELRRIRATLQREIDRKLATPAQDVALRAFRDSELEEMPYSRALAECEAATRFERSIDAPIASVSPTQYLLGTPNGPGGAEDPRNWGLLRHVQAMLEFLEALELTLQDDFTATPADDTKKRKWLAAAGLREMSLAFNSYMLEQPVLAEQLLSNRRYLLHGPMPERERRLAHALMQRVVRCMQHPYERFAQTIIFESARGEHELHRTPDGEIALEVVGNRLFAQGLAFLVSAVLGASGTGAFFAASQMTRREFSGEPLSGPPVWSEHHEALVRSHDATQSTVNALVDANARVRYGDIKALFDLHDEQAKPQHYAILEQDYAASVVRDAGMWLATEYHHRGILSDSALARFVKEFLTTTEGRRLQQAAYPSRKF